MKVVQVTTSSTGGAGIAALRLHKALRQQGLRSAYISKDKTIDFDDVVIEDPFFSYRKPSVVQKISRKLKSVFAPGPDLRLQQKLASMEAELEYEILSIPFSVFHLEEHPLIAEADLINLHWVGQILDYRRFFSAIKKPIVWTLHDMNPFMGIFHYQFDLNSNPVAKNINDEVFSIKRDAIKKIEKGAIVSPSIWLLEAAVKSKVFDQFKEKISIPNGIDFKVFDRSKYQDVRDRHGILKNEKVILFTSGTLDNPRKGLDIMLESIENLTLPVTLLTLGKGVVETSNKAVKIIPLGFIGEAIEIAACYAAADVLLLPSGEDNLPNTMLEAFASGTPVIGFATGGMQEHITTGFNGVLAEEITAAALNKAIKDFFMNADSYDAQRIRDYAKENFSLSKQAEGYIKVYENLLK